MLAALVVVFTVVEALTMQADRPQTPVWEVWTWAITSGIFALALLWLPWVAARRAAPGRTRWLPLILIHAAAGLTYSVLHVAGFVAARNIVYALMGQDYGLGPLIEDFPYELRKDLLTYGCTAAIFWLAGGLSKATVAHAGGPRTYDILDGRRMLRVEIDALLAVRAAGNYVEFMLEDGRRPLMRITLARLEPTLGFVRTHRSWLVNPARVSGLTPGGSGEWRVWLSALEVPLSRRYASALSELKMKNDEP